MPVHWIRSAILLLALLWATHVLAVTVAVEVAEEASGTITAADIAAGQLEVDQHPYRITDDTRIIPEGASLSIGTPVEVRYLPGPRGQRQLVEITVLDPPR